MKFKLNDRVIDTRRNIEANIISILHGEGEQVYAIQNTWDNEVYLATNEILIPYDNEYFNKNSYGG